MPYCPACRKQVYFAEKMTSLGKDWHRGCLKCRTCKENLTPGHHCEHEGNPYCHTCYEKRFGPEGFNNGNAPKY